MNPDEFFDLCDSGTAAQVREALDAGADVNARDECGATALMRAAGDNEAPEVIAALLDAGADVYARAWNGTALTYAADTNGPEVVRALMLAARWNTPEALRLLLAGGADPLAKDRLGLCAIDYAMKNEALREAMELASLMFSQLKAEGTSKGKETI